VRSAVGSRGRQLPARAASADSWMTNTTASPVMRKNLEQSVLGADQLRSPLSHLDPSVGAAVQPAQLLCHGSPFLSPERPLRVVDGHLVEVRPLFHAGGVAVRRAVPLLGPHGAARRRRARGRRGRAIRTSGPGGRRGRWRGSRPAGNRARACSRQQIRLPSVATSYPSAWAVPLVAGVSPSRMLINSTSGAVGADQPGDALANAQVELVERGHAGAQLGQSSGFHDPHADSLAAVRGEWTEACGYEVGTGTDPRTFEVVRQAAGRAAPLPRRLHASDGVPRAVPGPR